MTPRGRRRTPWEAQDDPDHDDATDVDLDMEDDHDS